MGVVQRFSGLVLGYLFIFWSKSKVLSGVVQHVLEHLAHNVVCPLCHDFWLKILQNYGTGDERDIATPLLVSL